MNSPGKVRTLAAIKETGELVNLEFSRHAIERFCERVRPGLGLNQACLQVQGLASAFAVSADRPIWAESSKALLWLLVGDAAFPLDPSSDDPSALVATTCLSRRTS